MLHYFMRFLIGLYGIYILSAKHYFGWRDFNWQEQTVAIKTGDKEDYSYGKTEESWNFFNTCDVHHKT